MSAAGFCPYCGHATEQLTLEAPAGPKARVSDPVTSKNAAKVAFPRAGTQRWKILMVFLAAPNAGLTADEVSGLTRVAYVSVSTRISELKAGGWLVPTGATKTTATGGKADLLRLTGRAHERLGRTTEAAAA